MASLGAKALRHLVTFRTSVQTAFKSQRLARFSEIIRKKSVVGNRRNFIGRRNEISVTQLRDASKLNEMEKPCLGRLYHGFAAAD
jgi:hypothetical protein